MNGLTLLKHISVISDPRQAWKVEHLLTDIIFVMVTAVIAGDEGGGKILKILAKIASNGYTSIMILGKGIPVHDTIARVVNIISAIKLQRCFSKWMKNCHEVTKGDVVAIDGKTIRGTYNKDKRCGAIHMVSAFSAANQTVLGQVKTADKSNESGH
ncbi:hypothetical protein BBM29_06960 [Vibrio parahaemolyticus]|nr:hypothetical protein BBM29_06960 [Vibrio parahaemolyticus]